MTTSSNGDIFRVTSHLCSEFTVHQRIRRTKASDAELWCFLWSAPWINGWVNNREAGDFRHRAHYDAIVMNYKIHFQTLTFSNALQLLIWDIKFSEIYIISSHSIHALQWRHNEPNGVSNHQPHECLLNRLCRRRSKKTSKLRAAGPCAGIHQWPMNSPHKWPVTRKMFLFNDVIMWLCLMQLEWYFCRRLFISNNLGVPNGGLPWGRGTLPCVHKSFQPTNRQFVDIEYVWYNEK